jgi:broad specificity phosphatase PhoE
MSNGGAVMRTRHKRQQPACRLVLVRHATAEGDGRFQGQADVPLSPAGRRQLPTLCRKLSRYKITVAYASDLCRARLTAAFAARRLGVRLEVRPGLREMHFGKWQGLSWEQVLEQSPQSARRWAKQFPQGRVPGGERFAQFKARIRRELRAIAAANPARSVLVVTHAGVIRVALASALAMPDRNLFRFAVDPCGLSVIDHFRHGVVVRCVND